MSQIAVIFTPSAPSSAVSNLTKAILLTTGVSPNDKTDTCAEACYLGYVILGLPSVVDRYATAKIDLPFKMV
ncbi:MAG: hypothetical protein AAGF66_07205, partial [Cyanobacteria bacterium P01_H01_bin.119]